ncbi:MAG: DUF2272 domain-containing protein, partial [Rhodobacteraceae bacterium]|nr:DUF2272 domain-containing protein [Paracoccaceae bacterium]
ANWDPNANPRRSPWSAAFISYLIQESGDAHGIQLSASTRAIWRSAQQKGLTFLPGEKEPEIGDIDFHFRGRIGTTTIQQARDGVDSPWVGVAGVIYAYDKKFIPTSLN